jgi:hypothetical protein
VPRCLHLGAPGFSPCQGPRPIGIVGERFSPVEATGDCLDIDRTYLRCCRMTGALALEMSDAHVRIAPDAESQGSTCDVDRPSGRRLRAMRNARMRISWLL